MGISNLLPMLEKSTRPCHISEFRGLTVGVDSYVWLHKGARSCAMQLARGEPTDLYVTYCMKYVNLLLSYNIRPIMVFDGRHLPAKSGTEIKRRQTKKQARKQGMEYLRLGQKDEAYKYFCQCVEITPEMALTLIKECRQINVDCIVAPYESDAQLAFFDINNKVDCIISEDSDLLLFGCTKVLYKMDLNGCGRLVESEKLYLSMKIREGQFNFDKFIYMCILAGCDYLDSLPGIGIKKALKFITMTAEDNPEIFIDRIPRYLNMKNLKIPEDYKENFLTAYATFRCQTVYDPFARMLTPLTERNMDPCYYRNSGDFFDPYQGFQLALGNINPLTMERIDNWDPDSNIVSEYSIWSRYHKDHPKPPTPMPMKKAFKCKTFDSKIIEVANTHYDIQVEKELQFYKSPTPGTVPVVENNSDVPSKVEPDISPTLGTNPFVKKKISRFQVTKTDCEQKVISRFFSTAVVGFQQNKTDLNTSTSSNSSSLITHASEDEGTVAEYADPSLDDYMLRLSPEDYHEPVSESGYGSSHICNSSHTDEDEMYLPQVECECIIEEGDFEVVPEPPFAAVQEPPFEVDPEPPFAAVPEPSFEDVTGPPVEMFSGPSTLSSVENLPKSANRKRKMEMAPEPKKKAKKQATIQDMFRKMQV